MAASGAQGLLRGPQRLAPACRADDQQIHEIDAGRGERGRIWLVRRGYPDSVLALASELRERRQDERELADAFSVGEALAQSGARPAAARQLGIEDGKAARHGIEACARSSAAPEDVALQQMLEGAHTVFSYSIGALARLSVRFSAAAAAPGRRP